jgi:hypothetical protein
MFHSPDADSLSAGVRLSATLITLPRRAKQNPPVESEKDNNDGDLGMSKNQAAPEMPVRRASHGPACKQGAEKTDFNGFATPFCGASAPRRHHLDGG